MTSTKVAVPTAGTWLAIASLLLVAALVLHGPISPDHGDQMRRIAQHPLRWSVAHWVAAAALSLFAMAGLIVLSSGSRLTDTRRTITAWAVVPVSAVWTLTTAVAEATVVANAAASGTRETFEAWWAFAEGKATGFAFLAIAIAVIATNDYRRIDRTVPAWASLTAAVASIASFAGWALGMWFGIHPGNLLWVTSSIVMCLWTLWFGAGLARSGNS